MNTPHPGNQTEILKQAEDELQSILDSIRAVRGESYYRFVLIAFNLNNCFRQAERCYCGDIPTFVTDTSKGTNRKMLAQVISNMIIAVFPNETTEKHQSIYSEVWEDVRILIAKQKEYAEGKTLISDPFNKEESEGKGEPQRPS